MTQHRFGGDCTSDKLERIRKYLHAYTTIFRANPRARHFRTHYVDAFAGTGYRASSPRPEPIAPTLFSSEGDEEVETLKKGSARIALEVEPPFDRYVFVERDADRAASLRCLVDEFPIRRPVTSIIEDDANAYLQRWCTETDWRDKRAVVFLDPYGMQVEWRTLEAIAATRAIDLWLLFPLGVAVNRLLTSNKPPPTGWAAALTRCLGTEQWREAFYAPKFHDTLFPDDLPSSEKHASLQHIADFFLSRLQGIFTKMAPNPLWLENSKGVPIYLLCFAAGDERGAPTAVKIAKEILGK